jgi:hypothetical protein
VSGTFATDETPEIWRHVLSNLDAMREHAPDGYEPVVHIHIAGRNAPLEVASFEGPAGDLPWTFFVSARHDDSDPNEGHPDDVMLFANNAAINAIELSFKRLSRQPIGFSGGGFHPSTSE